ncbi:MAG: CRTAC1 family protein, partial [Deltaproteobacteria bacterium]
GDYDGDGDLDLLVVAGRLAPGLLRGFTRIYRNDSGTFSAVDPGLPDLAPALARWIDLDLDGDLDLFLSTNVLSPEDVRGLYALRPDGRDRVLLQGGRGVFENVAVDVGLTARDPSFNSTLFDYDNDGDVDLYQSTMIGLNHVWRNELVETGTLAFTDVTREVSPWEGNRMADPVVKSFSTAAGDLNNDGWEDLVVFHRGPARDKHPMAQHLVWLNLGGERFVEVGVLTGLSDRWEVCNGVGRGVMGSQIQDVDLDGFIDVFIGNGSPDGGCRNELYLFDHLEPLDVDGWGQVMVPVYRDVSEWIDLPVDGADTVPYPYRTHGACFADYDDDGRPELAWVNGGPGASGDWVREPNRYFDVLPPRGWHFVTIRPHGDGVAVPVEPYGARVRATVRRSRDGATWEVVRTLYGGSGFVAHNGPDLFIGLRDADEIVELEITWPDGRVDPIDADLDTRVDVYR